MSDKKPDTPSLYFAAQREFYPAVNALMGGTRAMRDAGTSFLPQHGGETNEEYAARVASSTLHNVFRMTVRQMTGQAFAKAVTVDPATIYEDLLENIDQRGNSISQFLRRLFDGCVQKAEGFILVDMDPVSDDEQTLADSRRAGRRPYFVHIRPDQMLAMQTGVVAGREVITLARWETITTEEDPANEFGEVIVKRVTEYTVDGWRRWVRGTDSTGEAETWTLEGEGENRFAFQGRKAVPIVHIALVEPEESGERYPPLMDLADKNIEHWQSASDQRGILTFSRFAFLFFAGVDEDALPTTPDGKRTLGPRSAIMASDPQAKGMYLEPSGSAIEAGERDMARIVEEMAVLAAQPYITRPGDVTATRTALEDGKASSVIEHWLEIIRDGAEMALQYLAAWNSQDWKPAVTLDPDFGAMVNNGEVARALIDARRNGDLSREEFLAEMGEIGFLSDRFDPEANAAALEIEGGGLDQQIDDGGV